MITKEEIKRGMALITNPIGYLSASAIEKQIASSLKVYEDRGEFDGSLDSAIECLRLAAFKIEGDTLGTIRDYAIMIGLGDSPTVTVEMQSKLANKLRRAGYQMEANKVSKLSIHGLHDLIIKLSI